MPKGTVSLKVRLLYLIIIGVSMRDGVEREKVKLQPYDPAWEEEFIELRNKLKSVLHDVVIDIQHVGSTAVPGIS